MDKTLMRPLFKAKAEQLLQPKKIDAKKVPGFYLGGILAAGRGALQFGKNIVAPTYRYLATKGTQALANPTVRTGLTGLEGYGVGMGAGEIAEGVKEGDVGKVLTGASYAVPGAAFIPSTARGSGIAAVRKFASKLGDPTSSLGQAMIKNPGKTALGSFGTGITGMYLTEDEAQQPTTPAGMTKPQYMKSVEDRLIYSKPEIDTSGGQEMDIYNVSPEQRPVGVDKPMTKGEKVLNQQLGDIEKINQIAKKLGIEDATKMNDKQIKQVATEANVPEQNLRQYMGMPSKATGQPTPTVNPTAQNNANAANMGNYSDGEINALKTQRSKDLNNAKNMQKDPTLAEEFAQFKQQLASITGSSNDNLNDLVLMKAASKLMTGKTKEKGVRGFLDVGGQALGASADMMFQLALSQKQSDMELANAFLKARAKQSGVKIGVGEDVTVRVNDPSAPGGFINKKLAKGEDGKFYERKFVPGVGQQFAEAQYTGTDLKPNNEKINFNAAQLFENKRGGKMVEFVIDNALQDAGPKAAFGLLTERAFGTFDFLAGQTGALGSTSSTYDTEIKQIMKNNTEKSGIFSKKTEGEVMSEKYDKDIQDAYKNGAKRVEAQLKKAGIIAKDYRPSEEELTRYTKLALIEQRMKYIVANANKSEDRLTQKDIDNAAQRTQIIKFIASPREIRKNYENLRQEFREKAEAYLLQFKLNGGSEQFIQTNFIDIPGVSELYKQSKSQYERGQITKQAPTRNQILNTIPIAGGK